MFENPVLILSATGKVFQIYVDTEIAERLHEDLRRAGFRGTVELGSFRAGDREEEVSIIFLNECDKLRLKDWLRSWRKSH